MSVAPGEPRRRHYRRPDSFEVAANNGHSACSTGGIMTGPGSWSTRWWPPGIPRAQ